MWGNIVLYMHTCPHTRAHIHTKRERETFVGLHCIHISGFFLSAHPDKGPLQTRSSQGCHLLANMLSVIFCAPGSPSKAGPHGSPAHANRTNPSRTCLSVSLFPSFSCLLTPPLSLFLFLSTSSCLVSLLSHLFLSLSTCFPSSLSLSPSRSVPELNARAVCQLSVAALL